MGIVIHDLEITSQKTTIEGNMAEPAYRLYKCMNESFLAYSKKWRSGIFKKCLDCYLRYAIISVFASIMFFFLFTFCLSITIMLHGTCPLPVSVSHCQPAVQKKVVNPSIHTPSFSSQNDHTARGHHALGIRHAKVSIAPRQ